MSEQTATESAIESFDDEFWRWVAEHLNKWHYVSDEDRPWLSGRSISRLLDDIQKKAVEHGYTGGNLLVHAFERGENGWLYLAYDTGRFESPREAQNAYLEDEDKRWKERITLRVKDWLDRLNKLQENVSEWAQSAQSQNLSVQVDGKTRMHEELMVRYHVPPEEVNIFSVNKGSQKLATFHPRGLWVIGANGRVDITTPTSAPILVDLSYDGPSCWKMYISKRDEGVDFTRENFLELIGVQ